MMHPRIPGLNEGNELTPKSRYFLGRQLSCLCGYHSAPLRLVGVLMRYYTQTAIVVKFIGVLVITRNPVGISGPY